MTDDSLKAYISELTLPGGNTNYHLKDAEARAAIGDLETDKHDLITAQNPLSADYVSGLADVATSGDYADLDDLPTVDDAMDDESTNAVENNVIKGYIDDAIEDLGSFLEFKGTKSTVAEIEAITSAKVGDVWRCSEDNGEYICNTAISGTASAAAWDRIGPDIDLSIYELRENLGDLAFEDVAVADVTPAGTISALAADADAATASAMTDTSKVYRYTGNETGYVTGNLYKYENNAWVSKGAANYTPAGSISAGTLNVTVDTASFYTLDDVGEAATHGEDTFTEPSFTSGTYTPGTAASWSADVAEGTEVLAFSWTPNIPGTHGDDSFTASTFEQGDFDGGAVPTRTAVTLATGIDESGYSVDPAWTGTGTNLAFTGEEDTITVAPAV